MTHRYFLVALLLVAPIAGCDLGPFDDILDLGTPEAEERAREAPIPFDASYVPSWTELPVSSERRFEELRGGPVKQVEARQTFYDVSTPRPLPEDGRALLFCLVEVAPDRRYDAGSLPDPNLQLRVGDGPVQTMHGGEDILHWYFSVPVEGLHEGAPLWARVIDEDVFSHDRICEMTTVADDGAPIRFESSAATMECRIADPAIVESAAETKLARAERAIADLESVEPTATRPQLGYPAERFEAARRQVQHVVAWRGWDSPEVASLREAHARADERWARRVQILLAERRELLPAPGRPHDLGAGTTVTVEHLGCGAAATDPLQAVDPTLRPDDDRRCYVRLDVSRAEGRTLALGPANRAVSPESPLAVMSMTPDGRMVSTRVVRVMRDGTPLPATSETSLAAGDELQLLLAVDAAEGANPASVRELWVRNEGRPHLVRIR